MLDIMFELPDRTAKDKGEVHGHAARLSARKSSSSTPPPTRSPTPKAERKKESA